MSLRISLEHEDNARMSIVKWHIGRSWVGTPLEDDCPCAKAPCGLVDSDGIDPSCEQHALTKCKTMRQMHPPDQCPHNRKIL